MALKTRDFIFVRHGESEGNAKGLCQGNLDHLLTDKGRQQAIAAARSLINYTGINKIFSSNLKRAYETASIIGGELGCSSIEEHSGLQERGWGELQGKPKEAMHQLESMEGRSDFSESSKIVGLEDLTDFNLRVFNSVNSLLQRIDVSTPIIVGHGRFFYALCDLMKIPRPKKVPNATPLFCNNREGVWELSVAS